MAPQNGHVCAPILITEYEHGACVGGPPMADVHTADVHTESTAMSHGLARMACSTGDVRCSLNRSPQEESDYAERVVRVSAAPNGKLWGVVPGVRRLRAQRSLGSSKLFNWVLSANLPIDSSAMAAPTLPPAQIAEFCRRHGIARLSLFGSVLREDFSPQSDVDVLVEFQPGRAPGFIAFAGMQLELSRILARTVDLRTPAELSEYFRDEVLREARLIHAA